MTALSKPLSTLIADIETTSRINRDIQITGISTDSRTVTDGDIFVAIRGFETDGHRYVQDAVGSGADAVVIADDAEIDPPDGAVVIEVSDTRHAAAAIADSFYDHPSADLTIAGVTGTNGKTTVTLLLDRIFRAAGHSSAIIGTLGVRADGQWSETERTTPAAPQLQRLLAEMRSRGITHVAMEVSSHGIDLRRIDNCCFAAGVFTNLSQDHLDYHDDMEQYLETKLKLFTEYASCSHSSGTMTGAVNVDDAAGRRIFRNARAKTITYGIQSESAVGARNVEIGDDATRFDMVVDGRLVPVKLQLTGRFNVYNALAAAACCRGLQFDVDTIVAGLEGLAAVPGRFQRVDEGQGFTIIVDYAHTPQALKNLLSAVRELGGDRVLCVMGCGGDRDQDKRPKMGAVATKCADYAIITSDNPRSENPMDIIDQIEAGITGDNYEIEPDRKGAIIAGVQMCREDDILVIAGKGHETYQEFADHRIDFDDRQVARNAVRSIQGD